MTNTTDTQAPSTLDPRAIIRIATDTTRPIIAGVRPDQLDDRSPCPDLDVGTLVEHLVHVVVRVTAIGRGEDAMSTVWSGASVPDDGWVAVWDEKVADLERAWADDATLEQTVVLPWATQPGGAALVMYAGELSVHTWDLAKATGQQPAWNDAAVEPAYAWIKQGLPAEGRRAYYDAARTEMEAAGITPDDGPFGGPPFGEVVPVPDDAPAIDRLVAWQGRNPAWRA